MKIGTKLLETDYKRLAMVHRNQYGFLKTRIISDCLVWSLDYLHMCHWSKTELIIIKLELEKAFDKINHNVMIQIVSALGFRETWLSWMRKN